LTRVSFCGNILIILPVLLEIIKEGGEKMKKLILIAVALCLVISFAFAAESVSATVGNAVMPIKGTIIDNMCAGAHKADMGEFIKTHTKSCALMTDCAASGYSIYADGKLMQFDKGSSAKIEEFLKKDDSKLEVVVETEKVGDELKLVSIKNQ
jgi:opacity protein-like surface antigen